MGAYEDWNRMSTAEKTYIATHPVNAVIIKLAKDKAFEVTTQRFGHNGRNDESDAFRHCFWSAMLARDIGYYDALYFTTAHESDPNNPPAEKAMDLHNNGVGLWIGSHMGWLPDGDTKLADRCMDALNKGKLKHL